MPQGDAQQRRVRESVADVLLDPDQLLRQGLGVRRVAALLGRSLTVSGGATASDIAPATMLLYVDEMVRS